MTEMLLQCLCVEQDLVGWKRTNRDELALATVGRPCTLTGPLQATIIKGLNICLCEDPAVGLTIK